MADQERRTFLKFCVHGLGAVFAAVLGVPVVSYLIDPRRRQTAGGDLRPVSGIRLTELRMEIPVQGVIRDIRRDAWTLHPNDTVGRVWVMRTRDGNSAESFRVFTTECPHLGCSVNLNSDPSTGYTCPCHNGQFQLDGERIGHNPALRGMDSLEFEVDPADPDQLLVRFLKFRQTLAEKVVRT
ncbi:MAG: Rieske 2Fe-2S domain-containing protein [Gemmataceae bacterium]|nr:Rieske 2Fe-2S domain-containing protein [Gemmataceae bacterium]